MFIHAKYQAWKSMLGMDLAMRISSGTPWFGYATTKHPVFMVQLEMPKTIDHKRTTKYYTSHSPPPHSIWVTHDVQVKVDQAYGMAELDKAISEVMKISITPPVVILDPLYKAMSGNINDSHDVSKALNNLDFLKLKHKVTFIIIHHERKTVMVDGSDATHRGAEEMTGNLYISNWCDTAIHIEKVSPDSAPTQDLELSFTKHRNADDYLPSMFIRVRRSDLTFNLIKKTLDVVE